MMRGERGVGEVGSGRVRVRGRERECVFVCVDLGVSLV
jgi:hypothetical protein